MEKYKTHKCFWQGTEITICTTADEIEINLDYKTKGNEKIFITKDDNDNPVFILEDSEGQFALNIYEMLALACESDDVDAAYKLIKVLDTCSDGNHLYLTLRNAVKQKIASRKRNSSKKIINRSKTNK